MPTPSPAFTERQQRLLEAGVRVVAGTGLRGLTHRAVDVEAGLAQGTCSAYMRTRLALLTRLTEYVVHRLAADIDALTADIEARGVDPDHALRATSAVLSGWLRDPDLLVARMELSLESTRQPDLATLVRAHGERLVAVVAHAVAHAHPAWGPDEVALRAGTLVAALDGVLLRSLREPVEGRARSLDAAVVLLMEQLVAVGPDD
ncbi:TetR/AcrR family transcriptional regulator [Nocardioides aurantiacus]|uniref:TetR/AcrR family transcriptional regulator n=1 Tax=Nocardioides aurantiacus TaxID=86796 RepID=UPI00403FBFE2